MSSITNINNNASVVNVGRTTPVAPGRATADRSIPVVLASDQSAVPVEEQNKIQSEVALSLLGIPRSEVALGIFADVNTYDVNPSEWSLEPAAWVTGWGIRHLPNEAGALVEAPRNEKTILTSKRFFRYQPGRVSAATFGVKSTVSPIGADDDTSYTYDFAQNPIIRKYGIFDNFDGYYWETRQTGQGDNFAVVRRTQSLLKTPVTPMGQQGDTVRGISPSSQLLVTQNDDYRIVGKAPNGDVATSPDLYPRARQILLENKFEIVEAASANVTTSSPSFYENLAVEIFGPTPTFAQIEGVETKCKRDADLWLDFILQDMEWGGDGHVTINLTNFQNAILPNTDTYEKVFYQALRSEIVGLSLDDDNRAGVLLDIVIAASDSANTSYSFTPTAGMIDGIDYGTKPRLETVFDTKKYYWAYIVSQFTVTGGAITYNVPLGFTVDELRQKCQRDVVYVLEGYKNDILGGGNAETKYNMSMYFRGTGLSIFSQLSNVDEPTRHAHLQSLVAADLSGVDAPAGLIANPFGRFTTGDGFGFASTTSEYQHFIDLSTAVIENFSDENTEAMIVGDRGFAGNLLVYRDGLPMTHAAVFDSSLLKDAVDIPVKLRAAGNEITLSTGSVVRKQYVRYTGTATYGGLVPGTIYQVDKVIGQKGNTFTLTHVYTGNGDDVGDPVTFSDANISNGNHYTEVKSGDVVLADDTVFFQTVVPFIFPKAYEPATYRGAAGVPFVSDNTLNSDGSEDQRLPRGMMFPYRYSYDRNLEEIETRADGDKAMWVGYINTTLSDTNDIRTQIDNVNFQLEWVNWVRNNVKPEFWGVYEYRVPRSRFSHDTLDGVSEEALLQRVYSDRAAKEDGSVALPGELYRESGDQIYLESVYNFDFTKVTMLKIEFSWYGAVGALFLAYVPVENGEARWVRVHHLRASNQLKISSLGNATLPITYNVFGGGDEISLGDGLSGIQQGYESESHNIVKYGASYYIDGGDRGTVRLYSHNNDDPVSAIGKQWTATSNTTTWNNTDLSLRVDVGLTGANNSVDPVFFMGAKINTGNRVDNNIRVVWADATRIYLSARPANWTASPATGSITLIPDRAASVFGLETKRNIVSQISGNSVRNRVQVYPTKLSTSNLGNNPLRLRMKKTPIFQTSVVPSGTFALSVVYEVTSANLPLSVNESGTYLQNGESVYGWMKARLNTADSGPIISVFGRLYKAANQYYFELGETYAGIVFLMNDSFLLDKRFDAEGTELSGVSKSTSEKEGLSSILIADETQVPIPGTGINIATLYLQEGTEQFDLLSYFDYNKEYLSFPLTNRADTLYFVVDSDTSSATSDLVSLGVTWEEQ